MFYALNEELINLILLSRCPLYHKKFDYSKKPYWRWLLTGGRHAAIMLFLFGNTDMPQIMPQLEKLQKQME